MPLRSPSFLPCPQRSAHLCRRVRTCDFFPLPLSCSLCPPSFVFLRPSLPPMPCLRPPPPLPSPPPPRPPSCSPRWRRGTSPPPLTPTIRSATLWRASGRTRARRALLPPCRIASPTSPPRCNFTGDVPARPSLRRLPGMGGEVGHGGLGDQPPGLFVLGGYSEARAARALIQLRAEAEAARDRVIEEVWAALIPRRRHLLTHPFSP